MKKLTVMIIVLIFLFVLPASSEAHNLELSLSSLPIASILNQDGTINQNTSFQGNLDLTGWQMVADSPPRFAPTRSITALPGDENWASGFVLPGANQTVRTAVLDGSGNLYIGGSFTQIADQPMNRVARWDGSAWTALGTGINGASGTAVNVLLWHGSALYAGGNFTTANGAPGNRIAQWNGSTWAAVGSGFASGAVNALASNGTLLYAGGSFTTPSRIAQWDGSTWSAVDTGVNNTVNALVYDATSSSLYVGGAFTQAGPLPTTNRVARWDGTAWSRLGTASNNGAGGAVNALVIAGTDLYIGGTFTTVAGSTPALRVARWDSTNWFAVGSGFDNTVSALAIDSGGNIYAGGTFIVSGATAVNHLAVWDGISWSGLTNGFLGSTDTILTIAISGSTLYAGGTFVVADAVAATNIAQWNGSAWSSLATGDGITSQVNAIATYGMTVYLGGNFLSAGNMPANRVAVWDGSEWSALGTGMNNQVNALAIDSGGILYAGGNFSMAGGASANAIAQWNGSNWSALGSGITGAVNALAVDGNGDLYVAGSFTAAGGFPASGVAKWDGATWSNLSGGITGGLPPALGYALAIDSANNVYVAGSFTHAGGVPANNMARWNGANWTAIGGGTNGIVRALALDGSNLYVGGGFTAVGSPAVPANHIAQWDGANWAALGTGTDGTYVYSVDADGFGNVYVGGDFINAGGDSGENGIAYWDGVSWRALGNGVTSPNPFTVPYALVLDGGGYLYAGGAFDSAGGKTAVNFGRWTVLEELCGLAIGNNYFYTSTLPLTIDVNNPGTLACIQVQRFDKTHPNATTGLQTGYYWEINGYDAAGGTASGYDVNLTFSTVLPAISEDQICRYTGSGWECAASGFAGNTVTRTGVTDFSDWVVGPNTAPTLSSVTLTPSVIEGGFATLTGVMTGPELSDTFILTVDWGDGTTPQTFNYAAGSTTFSETHQYADDNPTGTTANNYTVSLLLSDGFNTDTTTTNITVNNVPPVLSGFSISPANENSIATLNGAIIDPGSQDTFTMTVDWGDGSAPATIFYAAGTTDITLTHQYLDDDPTGTSSDTYVIALLVTDDDTGSDSDLVNVTVNNVAPLLTNLSVTAVNEDGVATLTGTINDPGSLDTFTLVVNWGDGDSSSLTYGAATTSFNETHQYLDDDPSGTPTDTYNIGLTLTDDDTGSVTDNVNVTVTNLNPVVEAGNDQEVIVNTAVSFNGLFTDTGTLDTHTILWDFGDGNSAVSTLTPLHTYTNIGVYTATLTITDDDGGTTSDELVITVTGYLAHLPIVMNQTVFPYADLVVSDLVVSNDYVQIVVTNIGSRATQEQFWVDVYIDPTTPPTAVNQTWSQMGDEGLVWGATAYLNPGESITLTIGDVYYRPELSNFFGNIPAGTPVYAQADSANAATNYGSVLEAHEATGGVYNNIIARLSE